MTATLILGQQADGTPGFILVDSDRHLQVDMISVALPSGAATEAKQDTMITALQLIDDLRAALGSVNTDDLQVDVKTSALPTGAATEAKQDTQITALQLIDDLRNALATVATDKVRASVIDSALPTGAATEAKQDTMITALQLIDDLRNALASVATDKLRIAEPRERNPLKINLFYSAGSVAPHGQTTQWTYTVPAGKKAILEHYGISIVRRTAPNVIGLVAPRIAYTPSGGSVNEIAYIAYMGIVVGDDRYLNGAPHILMLAGDSLVGSTYDGSNLGTMLYTLSAVLTEFDA